MTEIDSIGLVELSSIARGFVVEDAMIKAARVQVLMARTICSGKFLIAVCGDVAAVRAAVEAGAAAGKGSIIERRHISRVPPVAAVSAVAGKDGILVDRQVIAAPSRELFREFV